MEYQTFKNEMLNYNRYKKRQRELEEQIDDIIYQFCGVKAIRYDREPSSYNPYLSEQARLKMSELLEKPQKELDFIKLAINRINENLNKLPKDIQEMARLLFIEGHTLHYVGVINNYSYNGIYQKLKREVEKIWDMTVN